MDKPLISYVLIYTPVQVGDEILVQVRSPEGKLELRLTSPVVDFIRRHNDNRPVFETLNSIYVPEDVKGS